MLVSLEVRAIVTQEQGRQSFGAPQKRLASRQVVSGLSFPQSGVLVSVT